MPRGALLSGAGALYSLNPLRAKIVTDFRQLAEYSFAGHKILMGKGLKDWQNTEEVLGRFGSKMGPARRRYREFVAQGVDLGRRPDLVGGRTHPFRRRLGAAKELLRSMAYVKGDERILGDSDFVNQVLSEAEEGVNRNYRLRSKGVDLEKLSELVRELFHLKEGEVRSPGKTRILVQTRSLLCYWAVRELGESMSSMSRRLNLSVAAVSNAVRRGEILAKEKGYSLEKMFKS